MEVSGRVGTFEGERFRGLITRRVLGKWRHIGIAIMIVIGLLIGLGIGPISRYAGLRYAASTWFIVGVIVAAIVAALMFTAMVYWLRRGWYARGTPTEIDVSYAVTTDGLVMTTKLSTFVARWPFLTEVMLTGDSWLIFGPGIAYFLPRRLFHTQAEEQAFMSALEEHLSPEARARSKVLLK